MSRHPSPADLAAFRAALNRRNGGAWLRPDQPTAHTFERLHGCPEWPQAGQAASHCRREAAAMRSRTYLRHPCGSVAHVLTLSGIPEVTCQRRAEHDGSHCARLPGAWQWWNRDDVPPPVEIPMAAYVNGGKPRDWIEPKPTR